MSKKDPGCFYTLSYPFIRFGRLYRLLYPFQHCHIHFSTLLYAFICFSYTFIHFHTLFTCFHTHSNAKKQNVPSSISAKHLKRCRTQGNLRLSRCAAGKNLFTSIKQEVGGFFSSHDI